MAATVLVTGATGFVGAHLVDALLRAGYRVRAALRIANSLAVGVEPIVVGDLGGDVDWSEALDGVDCVVHLAGLAHATGLAAERYERVNHRATATLASQAARHGVRRFVFLSSVLAQTGPRSLDLITEDRPSTPTSPYGDSKLAAERALRDLPIETVVLRPPLIYGGNVRGNLAKLVGLAGLRVPLPFGAIRNRRSLLAVDNLTDAILHCLREFRAAGETLLVADDTPLSLADMIAALRSGMGRKPGLVSMPPVMLAAAARLAGAGGLWERLAGDLVVSNRKLRSLGWTPGIDAADGLARMIRAAPRR